MMLVGVHQRLSLHFTAHTIEVTLAIHQCGLVRVVGASDVGAGWSDNRIGRKADRHDVEA